MKTSAPFNPKHTSKKFIIILIFNNLLVNVFSQGVAISTNADNAPAAGTMLHVYGTTRIGSAAGTDGVLIFNNASNAKTVTISPGTTGISYSMTLPPEQATGSNYVLLNDGNGNLSWGPPTAGTEWQLVGNTGTNPAINFLGTTDAQPLRLVTNNSERFRITSTGNIGIGTQTPSSKLEIKDGDVLLSNSGTAGALKFQGTSTGSTSIKAGAQGSTNISYTLPTAQGSSGSFLTNDGSGNLSWNSFTSGVATFDVSQGAGSVTSQTVSSTSDVNLNDMVISVPPGVYMIWFSSDVKNGNNSNACTVTIYTNGVANPSTQRTFAGLVKQNMVSAMGVVTVTGTAPTEIRVKVRVDGNSATFYNRSLMGLKIG